MSASNADPYHSNSSTHGVSVPPLDRVPMERCLSATSITSQRSSSDVRESLQDNSPGQMAIHIEKPRKSRGYVRPQGTDFAASARQRESVLSLGSIAHLQYYFARTGLLDGKGAQLQRRKRNPHPATLDLSLLRSDTTTMPRLSLLSPKLPGDTPPDSLSGSPDLIPAGVLAGSIMHSPVDVNRDIDSEFDGHFFLDEYDEPDPDMPPPTISTYNHREKNIPPPPSIVQLKTDLTVALSHASRALTDAILSKVSSQTISPCHADGISGSNLSGTKNPPAGWHETQGVHVLDVVTMAIRAAKLYYTTHPHPDRLDAVKPEKELRMDLLAVMDTLRKAASRSFANGFKKEEYLVMTEWIAGVRDMLTREEAVEEAEQKKRESWVWLRGDWTGRETDREVEFLRCMLAMPHSIVADAPPRKAFSELSVIEKDAKDEKKKRVSSAIDEEPLPEFTPTAGVSESQLPTPFLAYFRNGVRLVMLHNAAVRASRRRFGAIGTYYIDTAVPYRAAENIRFWSKAAELRWETFLTVDALAIVQGSGGATTWISFEEAILEWSRRVRTEIANEMAA